MTADLDGQVAAAWDLWRESSCLERGGHFWAGARGLARTRACRCCPVMLRDCDVCGGQFGTADDRRFRCSDPCREFAREHKHIQSGQLRQMWKAAHEPPEPCPSGKVRHQKKREAEASARAAERQRYQGVRRWLRVYECGLCRGWHLTSKPRSRRPPAAA